jgi:hypothetical protein
MDEDINVGDDQLPEDSDTPFTEPRDRKDKTPPDHPSKDSEVDSHDWYDDAQSATGADESSEGKNNG